MDTGHERVCIAPSHVYWVQVCLSGNTKDWIT